VINFKKYKKNSTIYIQKYNNVTPYPLCNLWHIKIKTYLVKFPFSRIYFPILRRILLGIKAFRKIINFKKKVWYEVVNELDYSNYKKVHKFSTRLKPKILFYYIYPFSANKIPLSKNSAIGSFNIYLLRNASILYASDLTLTNDKYILENPLFDHKYFIKKEEENFLLRYKNNNKLLLLSNKKKLSLKNAINCCSFLSGNYAHFMTEVVPKIFLICSLKEYDNFDFIFSSILHKKCIDFLASILPKKRIFIINNDTSIDVTNLLHITTVGFTPYNLKFGVNPIIKNLDHFSMEALKIIRSKLINPDTKATNFPSKIFIIRTSSYRSIINYKKIVDISLTNGFVLIDPMSYSIQEQIEFFNNADIIIGQAGANLVNCIFCKAGCKVGVLAIDSKHANHNYLPTLFSLSAGIKTYFLLSDECPTSFFNSNAEHVHSDFFVDEDRYLDFINSLSLV